MPQIYGQDDEYEIDPEEVKANGPYSSESRITSWNDFMGRPHSKVNFVVINKKGQEVARCSDLILSQLWAMQLTHNGFIEE